MDEQQGNDTPYRCMICGYYVSLDDAVAWPVGGRCICLGCFNRETGHTEQVPVALRRDIDAEDAALLLRHFNDEESALLLRRSARRSTDA